MLKRLIALVLIMLIFVLYYLIPKSIVAYNTNNLNFDNTSKTKVVMQIKEE
ncbi:hypothetical protein [Thermovenabulum gondwanense]|uniref:Uncharacterized protein n=1 Tax=Thermovenabulum gondwanense TaxID=520767 RepID=A0A162MM97_9FIRM|nr:hypothetical protein [Thermovenabulum gondwanense]KYO66692.1 hypothetical protein ATZ99_09360 [Thermovenabulum gondwanense]